MVLKKMRLEKKINVVESSEGKKHYSNYALVLTIGQKEYRVPIRPINFNNKNQLMRSYQLLDIVSELVKNE